jgi:ABC-type lipoprotein release transport system permease subunit
VAITLDPNGDKRDFTVVGVVSDARRCFPVSSAAKLIASMHYDLAPNDPPMILMAVGILAAVALTAGYVPARKAALIDPMRALRSE